MMLACTSLWTPGRKSSMLSKGHVTNKPNKGVRDRFSLDELRLRGRSHIKHGSVVPRDGQLFLALGI